MLTWDASGAVLDANDALLSLTGWDRDALERGELRWTDLFASATPSTEHLASFTFGSPHPTELKTAGGGRVPAVVGGAPFDEERHRGVGFVLDRRPQQRSDEQLEDALARERDARRAAEDARERLASMLHAREDALATVSHDLRTPLQTVDLGARYLDRSLPRSAEFEPARRQVAAIRRASEQMASLVRDLLDLARIEAGRLALHAADVDAAAMVDHAVEAHRLLAEARPLVLEAVRPHGLRCRADRNRLEQVLANLLSNALKFTPPAGRVEVGARHEGPDVLFWVADGGPGIAPEELPHVFERFWHTRDRSAAAGTGLGLAIAKGIVEAHGGRIWVESGRDQGSRFSFTVPAAP
jgi:signal transduction histidine kinase